jgi:CubicO group peptidase (beta-lactamase class C family)
MTSPCLTPLVAAAPTATAVTLAVLHDGHQEVWCHGRESAAGPPTTPATAYEIGSATKTFTALLLAEMTAHGEVGLHDPVHAHLPAGYRLQGRHAGSITLLHLATHTSGLPRLPPGLLARALPTWFSNPYSAYGDDQLLEALRHTQVHNRPGNRLCYSNYGVALLGRALAETAGLSYPKLLAERVCHPLGLTATTCEPDPVTQAVGHRRRRPLPPWLIPGLPAAGSLRSTGTDLIRYLSAHLDPPGTPVTEALREVQRPRLRPPRSADQLCLIWNRREVNGSDLLFHSGATRGFTSFLGFAPQAKVAVAAMANTGPSRNGRFVQSSYSLLRRFADGAEP